MIFLVDPRKRFDRINIIKKIMVCKVPSLTSLLRKKNDSKLVREGTSLRVYEKPTANIIVNVIL